MIVDTVAFTQGGMIPQKYTCEGKNLSPPLHLGNIPAGTKSLVIIMDDPDAPVGVFDHWIAWNIPVSENIAEGISIATVGKNGFGVNGYRGPCPPSGETHRYFFKIYALDSLLDLPVGSSKSQVKMP